jgi:hypothetical protein
MLPQSTGEVLLPSTERSELENRRHRVTSLLMDGSMARGLSDPVEECNALQHMGHCPLNRFNVQNEKNRFEGENDQSLKLTSSVIERGRVMIAFSDWPC